MKQDTLRKFMKMLEFPKKEEGIVFDEIPQSILPKTSFTQKTSTLVPLIWKDSDILPI